MQKALLFSLSLVALLGLSGCRYYGSAIPPENPMSMGDALGAAGNSRMGVGGQRGVVRVPTRPNVERPSYLPEKELALVAPPQTLLVWSYPYVTDDNTRQFGNWSTIFLTDRYEWAKPSNQLPQGASDVGMRAGRPNIGLAETPPNPAVIPPVTP
jgi:hypothetical protein